VTRVTTDELNPPVRAIRKTVSANAPGGWEGTTITFDLRTDGDGTVLLFAHRGFKQADEGYARVTTGWGYYLVSLRQYLETGKGAPHPDIDFARVIR
jgi:Activator of Hsp90 ATPase homolog 1-like protein